MIARAHQLVAGPVGDVEALYHDRHRWASWIDGFAYVKALDPSWPAAGAVLEWDSKPAGRGRVRERVRRHEAGALLELEVEDIQLTGLQRLDVTPQGAEVLLTLTLDYSLKDRTPVTPIVDRLFVRRAMAASLRRTLAAFARERAAAVDLG